MSAAEIQANFAKFGCHHIALGRHLKNGPHQSAAPWLEAKMRGVAPPIEPVKHIVEGARGYASQRGLPDPHDFNPHSIVQSADMIHHLGRAYDALPYHDASAVPHFEAMRQEVNHQFDHLTKRMGVKAEFVDHDPYKNAGDMAHDLRANKRIQVLRTAVTGHHPFFSDEENDKFRAVHDAFGHAGSGRDFDGHGEEAAFHAHARMFSPMARGALASETRGQNGSVILHDSFSPQKIALMPSHLWTPAGMEHNATLAEDYRLHRYDQEQRAERASGGYAEETRAFYGDGNAARGGHTEKSLTFKDYLHHMRDPKPLDADAQTREYSKGYDMGARHGDAGHIEANELTAAHATSPHPDHFGEGYANGWDSTMEHTARFAQLLGYSGKLASVDLGEPQPLRIVAHVSGNSIDVLHCPFCGSGAVVARSDGTIECNFCTSVFTVQVQPQYPSFPMTSQGQPYPWPGQPDPASVVAPGGSPLAPGDPLGGGIGGAPGDINGVDPSDPNADGIDGDGDGGNPFAASGVPDGGDASDDDDPSATVGGNSAPPFGKGKSKSKDKGKDDKSKKSGNPFAKKTYLTTTGSYVEVDDYIAHLAIVHASDPAKVASMVKASRP